MGRLFRVRLLVAIGFDLVQSQEIAVTNKNYTLRDLPADDVVGTGPRWLGELVHTSHLLLVKANIELPTTCRTSHLSASFVQFAFSKDGEPKQGDSTC